MRTAWRAGCGLRLVAADASLLMPATRACLLKRSAAQRDQRLFALYLLGAELTLHASVHRLFVAERRMRVEALDVLGPDDVRVLDRGYPAAWLATNLDAAAFPAALFGDLYHPRWRIEEAFKRLKPPLLRHHRHAAPAAIPGALAGQRGRRHRPHHRLAWRPVPAFRSRALPSSSCASSQTPSLCGLQAVRPKFGGPDHGPGSGAAW